MRDAPVPQIPNRFPLATMIAGFISCINENEVKNEIAPGRFEHDF